MPADVFELHWTSAMVEMLIALKLADLIPKPQFMKDLDAKTMIKSG